jgi:hypothetical protein
VLPENKPEDSYEYSLCGLLIYDTMLCNTMEVSGEISAAIMLVRNFSIWAPDCSMKL